ncbi:MAG: acyl-CoA dehydrogenase family protein [Acidimicrobiales bacterium]
MDFAFSQEQEELRGAVRRFLADKSPEPEVRRLMATPEGYDPAVWKQMAEQLGLQSLAVPERHGGAGFGFVELVIVLEEMGGALLCAPFLSSAVLGAQSLITSGDEEAMGRWLPGIVSGETIATLAVTEDSGRWDLDGIGLVARRSDEVDEGDGGGWVLEGHKSFVLDGYLATLLLVAARSTEGIGLFAVRGDAPRLTRTPLPTLDQTRKQARLEFGGTPGTPVGEPGGARAGIAKTLQLAAVALAAEQVGGAQHCLDRAVEYAKSRVQFGRPIGSFQAIKHKCADLLVEVEFARSAAYYAGWAAAEDSDELLLAASLAKSYCSGTYFHAAAENIQIHGGIGFTWEHDAHLYLKRAKSSELLFGDPTYHRELLARRLGI